MCPQSEYFLVITRLNMLFSPTLGPGGQKARGPIQCVGRASLPIGVNDGERGKQDNKRGKGENKTTEKF